MATLQSQPQLASAAASAVIPSLRSNFAWTLAGNVVYAGCQWGMLSCLAKLGNPTIVGQFTLGLAISAPVFMFTNLQLRAVQATDVNAESSFAHYFTLRFLATVLGMLAVLALLPFSASSGAVRAVILLVSLSKCLECMSDVTAGLLQREEQLKRVAISLMIRGVISVVVFSSAFALTRNLVLSIIGMCAVWACVLLFYDLPNVRRFGRFHNSFFHFDRHELSRLAFLGLPLGWVATCASLKANIPRYFLQHDRGLSEQGIYASLAYLVIAINPLVSALTVAVTTRLANLYAQKNSRLFVRILTQFSLSGCVFILVGVPLALLLGRSLISLVYNSEYAAYVTLLALLVCVAGLSTISSFIFCGLTAARSFRSQVPIYVIAIIIATIASAQLIPTHGLNGAGTALLLSESVLVIGGLYTLRRQLGL